MPGRSCGTWPCTCGWGRGGGGGAQAGRLETHQQRLAAAPHLSAALFAAAPAHLRQRQHERQADQTLRCSDHQPHRPPQLAAALLAPQLAQHGAAHRSHTNSPKPHVHPPQYPTDKLEQAPPQPPARAARRGIVLQGARRGIVLFLDRRCPASCHVACWRPIGHSSDHCRSYVVERDQGDGSLRHVHSAAHAESCAATTMAKNSTGSAYQHMRARGPSRT